MTHETGPKITLRTLDANIACAFVETALVFVVPKSGVWGGFRTPKSKKPTE